MIDVVDMEQSAVSDGQRKIQGIATVVEQLNIQELIANGRSRHRQKRQDSSERRILAEL